MRAAPRVCRQVASRASPGLWEPFGSLIRCCHRYIHIRGPGGSRARRLLPTRAILPDTTVAVEPHDTDNLDKANFTSSRIDRHTEPTGIQKDTRLVATVDLPASHSDWPKRHSNLARDGKWTGLALQYSEIKRESDISGIIGPPRLVDYPENVNDIHLWNTILEFRHRRDGTEGVRAVLQALQARRVLWEVEGPWAATFWEMILKEAVLHEDMLLSAWEYAEWLYESYRVRWPKFYETVLSSFITRKSLEKALQWHLRLSPNYGIETPAFAELLQRFIRDPHPTVQQILWDVYRTSHHRQLYDRIVPYLYSQGHLALARTWRWRLTLMDDIPESFAARPFLRFMAGYFPRGELVPQERLAAGLNQDAKSIRDPLYMAGAKPWRIDELISDDAGKSHPQLVNRIHGRTFGIKEKSYNDTLGARWFASSWISVDLALDVVRFLGLDRIGPLSLQSIALREGHPDRILDRLDQLELSGISIGDSSYAKAIRHFATMDDHETLMDLLHSDLHPDVFDDPVMQAEVLELALRSGNWKQYRLVLSVRVAVSLDTLLLYTNRVVIESLSGGNGQMTVRLLGDMHRRGAQLLPSTSDAISMHIIDNAPLGRRFGGIDLDSYVALCRLVMATRFPLATRALRTVLFNLGREGRLEELESLSVEILERYKTMRKSTRPTLNVHRSDVPDLLREGHGYGGFQLIPGELNLRHDMHPIQMIFDKDLQHQIIYWGFTAPLGVLPVLNIAKHPRQPVDFSFARGVRLLAILRDNGVVMQEGDVEDIRKAVELNLAIALGDYHSKRLSAARRWIGQLGLEQAKVLCDEAWGAELLSPLPRLKAYTQKVAAELETDRKKLGHRRKWSQLDPAIRIVRRVARPRSPGFFDPLRK